MRAIKGIKIMMAIDVILTKVIIQRPFIYFMNDYKIATEYDLDNMNDKILQARFLKNRLECEWPCLKLLKHPFCSDLFNYGLKLLQVK